jgi:hypothetical protein
MTKRMAIGDVVNETRKRAEGLRQCFRRDRDEFPKAVLALHIITLKLLGESLSLAGHSGEQIDVEDGDDGHPEV